jgi:uncharacterized Rmd1/YagE family protein
LTNKRGRERKSCHVPEQQRLSERATEFRSKELSTRLLAVSVVPTGTPPLVARALQVAERIELKGLERPDQFSSYPLAFNTANSGTVVLFRFGAAVFISLNPLEEESIINGLAGRLSDPLAERESETLQIVIDPASDDQVLPNGMLCLKDSTPERHLLVAEALATSVTLAYDEHRIAQAFDRVVPIASSLKQRKLLGRSQGDLLEQIGEALLILLYRTAVPGSLHDHRVERRDKEDSNAYRKSQDAGRRALRPAGS